MFVRQQRSGRGHSASSIHRGGNKRNPAMPMFEACRATVERLEARQMLAGDGRLIGITGNQGNSDSQYIDETLFP